jgi:hypothetical protein
MGDCWALHKEPRVGAKETEYLSRKDNTYLFGFIGDTHIGSKYCRYDVLNDLYDKFADAEVDRVLHAGNWIEGEARFNKYDIDVYGLDAQCQALADFYPNVGIVTYAVTGDDHEGWFAQREGIDIGKHMESVMIENGRSDWADLGYIESFVGLKNINSKKKTQLSVMHPGGGSSYATCFVEGAEILTKTRGWVPFSELQYSDDVATMTKDNHTFEWQQPTDIIKEQYEGDVHHYYGKSFNFTVTPNHRILQASGRGIFKDCWYLLDSENILNNYRRQETRLCLGSKNWFGIQTDIIKIPRYISKRKEARHINSLKIQQATKLLAWYITEGCVSKDKQKIVITQCPVINSDNFEEIIKVLQECGFDPKIEKNGNNIVICSVELGDWLIKNCGRTSYEKQIPIWLKEQPKNILKLLLATMMKGDGCIDKNHYTYYTVSKKLADDICEVAQKCGFSCSCGINKSCFYISIKTEKVNPTINNEPKREYYNGTVYCCSVPNELIYVRMNGKCFWSGNSYKPQKIVESFSGGDKPAVLMIGHYHKLSYNHFRNVHCIQVGCTQDQTPFLRKKGIHVDVGGGICKLTQDPKSGSITACQVEFFTYQVRGFYNNRWNKATKVKLPKRSTK